MVCMAKKINDKPVISIADCEAAVWRLTAVVYRDKKMAKAEMAKVVGVIEQFALSCGADPGLVTKGLMPGLAVRVREPVVAPEPKVHLGDTGEMAVCRQAGVKLTSERADVTCGNCKRWMAVQDRKAAAAAVAVEISQPTLVPHPEPDPGTRTCYTCGLDKDLETAYARDSKNRLGRKTVCRDCDNARRRALNAARKVAA